MIKLKPTTGTLTAGTTIPLTQVFNSNPKLILSNNEISIRDTGFVEFEGDVNVTSTVAGAIAINVLVDGNIASTTSVVSATIGDVLTIPVYDLFRVIPSSVLNGFSKISLQLVNAATISGGVITAKYIR